jgi:hypothetical protein
VGNRAVWEDNRGLQLAGLGDFLFKEIYLSRSKRLGTSL